MSSSVDRIIAAAVVGVLRHISAQQMAQESQTLKHPWPLEDSLTGEEGGGVVMEIPSDGGSGWIGLVSQFDCTLCTATQRIIALKEVGGMAGKLASWQRSPSSAGPNGVRDWP